MLDVVIALLPALAVSTWVFGFSVLLVTCTSVACCVVFEYLIQRFLLRGPLTVNNWSAVVTGMLLAFNLPSSIPLWMVAVGALVSIGVGKMTFGRPSVKIPSIRRLWGVSSCCSLSRWR